MFEKSVFTVGILLGIAGSLVGCIAPAPPVERATDAARELNLATRFGRMDVAISRTDVAERSEFVKRHAGWGNRVRVLDVELTGMEMKTPERATVFVDVSWVRLDESILRTTRIAQTWTDRRGSWRLTSETPVLGDGDLFAKAVERVQKREPDVHLPAKTIR